MKVILLGNAGAGKSTLARRLLQKQQVARLSLDEVAFSTATERRPLDESIAEVQDFIEKNENWIIEGCYADILEPVLDACEELYFLNPGIETCVAHCMARPWEPEKFVSAEEQNQNLQNLLKWVRAYESRDDEYGLKRHRALFESFAGKKREFNDPSEYVTA